MKKILFNIILAVSLCGCSSFLEPDSPSEYVPKTANALNEMLLGDAYPLANSTCLFTFHNALDDDIEMSEDCILQTSSSGIEGLIYIRRNLVLRYGVRITSISWERMPRWIIWMT